MASDSFDSSQWTCSREELIVHIAKDLRSHQFESPERFLNEHDWLVKGSGPNGRHLEDVNRLIPMVQQHIALLETESNLSEFKHKSPIPEFSSEDSISTKAKRYADWLLENHHFYASSERSQLWRFDEKTGIWKPDGTSFVQQVLTGLQNHDFKSHLVNEVLNCVHYSSYDPDAEFGGPPEKLVMKNGTLDLNTLELSEKPAPKDYQIIRVPLVYDPDAHCPAFEEFLKQVIPIEEDRRAVVEFFGYCLLKEYIYEIIMLLVGEGANGKTILLSVLKRFLGPENVTAVTPQQLDKSRFAAAQLHGKLADVAGDIPAQPLSNTGTIKMLSGGDLVYAEHKHRDPFNFLNYAKLIFSANQVPESWDTTTAFYRRFRIVEFPNQFAPQDPGYIPRDKLINQLTTESELSGILNLALEGLKRLRNQGCLSGEPTQEDRRMDYIRRSNVAHYFFERFMSHDVEAPQIAKRDLYNLYVRFSHALNKQPDSEEYFGRKLRRLVPYASDSRPREGDQRITVWNGIAFDYNRFYEELGSEPAEEDEDQKKLEECD